MKKKNSCWHELRWAVAATLLWWISLGPQAVAKMVNVMTTTEDLASLAREVGGDHAKVESIARGYQDPHFVEAKPSFLLKLQKADLLIVVGLGLESGWLPPLITQSRNSRIQVGAPGYLDASGAAVILEKPSGPVTRAMGDVHPLGNPHYWLDPDNGRRIAKAIADKLAEIDPEDAAYFEQRYQDFDRRLQAATKRWEQEMVPIKDTEVITYHNSWPSFTEHFGLRVGGFVEPKPGIPPSPRHTLEVINQIKQDKIKLILVEPYFDLKTPNAIARQTGAKVLVILPSVGGEPEVKDYLQLFDYNIRRLKEALAGQR
ncbi:MAG: zinc ABC transporter substrate-binding protein [Acidobacteria bacterium]|nr:zinc ABC transporter substrate-binding protein [Acidobacteriota bacterium]